MKVMGILNATPDSFSDGGDLAANPKQIADMLDAGADMLDVGGQSTRPGHEIVSPLVEIERVVPVLEAIRALDARIPISIDTQRAAVATAAFSAGADRLNDVSGLAEPALAAWAGQQGCPVILMRSAVCSEPVVASARQQLGDIVKRALAAGVERHNITLDPGLGFGARPGPVVEDNLALIDRIRDYAMGYPVLIGASRKRFVGAMMNEPDAKKRVTGSVELALRARDAGAAIVRVHDVLETVAALQ